MGSQHWPPGAMQGRGLPFRVATLLTGLLECLGFAGVLFGWTSLVFVFKKQHYFEELCEPDAGSLGNATGLDGKGAGPSLESGSQMVGRRARQDSGPPRPHPGQAFYGEKKGASASPILNLDLRGVWGGRCPLPRADQRPSRLSYERGNISPPAGCPRWKRLPWTGNRLGACLPGRLGRVGGLARLPGLLRWARLSSRLQGPGRAVLTHLHPGLLHEQLHDLPHGLHLRPFQDHRGPPHRHVGPRGAGPGLGKRTVGRGVVCREP